jgi:hypothetical protein
MWKLRFRRTKKYIQGPWNPGTLETNPGTLETNPGTLETNPVESGSGAMSLGSSLKEGE